MDCLTFRAQRTTDDDIDVDGVLDADADHDIHHDIDAAVIRVLAIDRDTDLP